VNRDLVGSRANLANLVNMGRRVTEGSRATADLQDSPASWDPQADLEYLDLQETKATLDSQESRVTSDPSDLQDSRVLQEIKVHQGPRDLLV
jgi:hypothetical protein